MDRRRFFRRFATVATGAVVAGPEVLEEFATLGRSMVGWTRPVEAAPPAVWSVDELAQALRVIFEDEIIRAVVDDPELLVPGVRVPARYIGEGRYEATLPGRSLTFTP